MRKTIAPLLTLLLLPFAVACATGSYADIQSEKVNPQFHGGPGKKVLVVVATADPGMRQDVETAYVVASGGRNVEIIPSVRFVPSFKDLSKEKLQEIVKAEGFDRVILTRTIPNTAKTGTHTRYEDYYTAIPPNMYDYWQPVMSFTFTPTDPPPSMGRYMTLTVETLMFDASDAAIVYSSTAKVTTGDYAGDATKGYVNAMLNRMASKGLL